MNEEDTIEACLGRIRAAWDAGDAHAYAQEFTADATYVIFLGDALLGREEIERNHVPVFTRWQRDTRMRIEPLVTRHLREELAVVLTAGGIGKGSAIALDTLQTYTLVREAGRWRCCAFHNSSMSRRTRRAHRAPLRERLAGVVANWLERTAR